MKVFQINICPDQSTGRVMNGIADAVRNAGGCCITAAPPKNVKRPVDDYVIGSNVERKVNILLGKIINTEYKLNYLSTIKLIRKIRSEKPDIIHFHNLHAYYLNLPLLFKFIVKEDYAVVWTFHDCWPLTGHCTHFLISRCNKWKNGCNHCKQYHLYPGGWRDNSKKKYLEKKKIFTSVLNLVIVTPSAWLSEIVSQSYLASKKRIIINNGIDLSVFCKCDSDFRRVNELEHKYIILGVASQWERRKGIDVFNRLAEDLDDDYKVVLVGSLGVWGNKINNRILSIGKTDNSCELAKIYSMADLFVNPTREDTFPTVNIEALACGTPVLTFRTGGSSEVLDETCGVVVECEDINTMKREIIRICEMRPFSHEACIKRAKLFDMNDRFKEYIDLYDKIISK